jgi:hypothetical protein
MQVSLSLHEPLSQRYMYVALISVNIVRCRVTKYVIVQCIYTISGIGVQVHVCNFFFGFICIHLYHLDSCRTVALWFFFLFLFFIILYGDHTTLDP